MGSNCSSEARINSFFSALIPALHKHWRVVFVLHKRFCCESHTKHAETSVVISLVAVSDQHLLSFVLLVLLCQWTLAFHFVWIHSPNKVIFQFFPFHISRVFLDLFVFSLILASIFLLFLGTIFILLLWSSK